MLRHLLRRYGLWPTILMLSVTAVVISVALTTLIAHLFGGGLGAIGLFIAILVPAIIASLFGLFELRLLDQLQKAEDQLRLLSTTDDLTQAHNRRHFLDLAEHELARARRHGETLALVLLDLDRFKHINDTYGHLVGDEALRRLSTLCRAGLRASDPFARYGGDESTILLPATRLPQAQEIVERLRHKRADTTLSIRGRPLRVTFSAGIALYDPNTAAAQSLDSLLQRADEALYAAKNTGGNHSQATAQPAHAPT
ncbi:MAG: GGDEF domain-containing protein [Anaerolineales bacterium]|nr:GGDEF domain-containing protein [Anaerolineales bacterium]